MYSTAKKMATMSAIVCTLNIFGGFLFCLVTMSLNLSFAVRFSMIMYLATTSVVTLMLTLGLRSICQDLEYEYEDNTKKLRELSDRLSDVEHKV